MNEELWKKGEQWKLLFEDEVRELNASGRNFSKQKLFEE